MCGIESLHFYIQYCNKRGNRFALPFYSLHHRDSADMKGNPPAQTKSALLLQVSLQYCNKRDGKSALSFYAQYTCAGCGIKGYALRKRSWPTYYKCPTGGVIRIPCAFTRWRDFQLVPVSILQRNLTRFKKRGDLPGEPISGAAA